MTPAEALIRALEQNECSVDTIDGCLATLRSWLANEAVETVARAIFGGDHIGGEDEARAALRAIFGELAP